MADHQGSTDEAAIDETGGSTSSPTSSSTSSSTTTNSLRLPLPTQIRKAIFPYLPPPVIQTIQHIDLQLDPYLQVPEPTLTVIGTAFLAWCVIWLVKGITRVLTGGKGRAIQDEDDGNPLSTGKQTDVQKYSDTVLLVGPTHAGKSRLFYQLCFGEQIPTVQSIKANIGVLDNLRYIDWPGYAKVSDAVLQPILQASPRILLVVDSTQSMANASDILYQLCNELDNIYAKKRKTKQSMVVVCHKQDLKKAKNSKRIKLQLRNELDRLVGIHKPSWATKSPLELEDLPFLQLSFVENSCEKAMNEELVTYCKTGVIEKS